MGQAPAASVRDIYGGGGVGGGGYVPQNQGNAWTPSHQQIPAHAHSHYASSAMPQQQHQQQQLYGQPKPAGGSYYGAPDSSTQQYY